MFFFNSNCNTGFKNCADLDTIGEFFFLFKTIDTYNVILIICCQSINLNSPENGDVNIGHFLLFLTTYIYVNFRISGYTNIFRTDDISALFMRNWLRKVSLSSAPTKYIRVTLKLFRTPFQKRLSVCYHFDYPLNQTRPKMSRLHMKAVFNTLCHLSFTRFACGW